MIPLHCLWAESNNRTRGQFERDVTCFVFVLISFVQLHGAVVDPWFVGEGGKGRGERARGGGGCLNYASLRAVFYAERLKVNANVTNCAGWLPLHLFTDVFWLFFK